MSAQLVLAPKSSALFIRRVLWKPS